MTRSVYYVVVGFVLSVAIPIVLLVSLSTINSWERDHNYPYGQVCKSFLTGSMDTCPLK